MQTQGPWHRKGAGLRAKTPSRRSSWRPQPSIPEPCGAAKQVAGRMPRKHTGASSGTITKRHACTSLYPCPRTALAAGGPGVVGRMPDKGSACTRPHTYLTPLCAPVGDEWHYACCNKDLTGPVARTPRTDPMKQHTRSNITNPSSPLQTSRQTKTKLGPPNLSRALALLQQP